MRGYPPPPRRRRLNTMAEAEGEWLTPADKPAKAIYRKRDMCETT
jgi:hypothetical protein